MNKSAIAAIFSSQSITPASTLTIIFSLVMAFAVGLFIHWTYRMNYKGVMYSRNFGLTLVLMTLITTPVVMCIKDSIQLSMGMVGALSIVRFRTAVKDPLDTAYMFWALTMGILLGAGQFFLTALCVLGIGLLIFLLTNLSLKGPDSYLLVIRAAGGMEGSIAQIMKGVKTQKLKSKSVTRSGVEMTYEIRTEKGEQLVNRLLNLEGVEDATLVTYQTENV